VDIQFSKHKLSNGLTCIIHEDKTSPLVTVNILYNVGSKDESPQKTGFAHLFEHLMFGGSVNIPTYDSPLQFAGGENNAFTSPDITNYYLTVPKQNIETAFWLESDRMLSIKLSKESLDVQRKVVIEEFNQRYLNQPYGNIPLLLQPLAYTTHPYMWPTIGKDISHIRQASLDDVEHFYSTFYNPQNAILVVAGDVKEKQTLQLVEKWFGDIDKPHTYTRNIPFEPQQTKARRLEVIQDVPLHKIIISFPMAQRLHQQYYVCDIITDILSEGKGSKLYQSLVRKHKLFSSINAYISGSIDAGQIIVSGTLLPETSIEHAEKMIWKELRQIATNGVTESEMEQTRNKIIVKQAFEKINILEKAMNLAYYELLGSVEMIHNDTANYMSVTAKDVQQTANILFQEQHSSSLLYLSKHLL
jgi:zinc protease